MREYSLEDVCLKITDGAHFSPRGVKNGYPMLSVKDMREYGFSYENCKYIEQCDYDKLVKQDCIPHKGDVLVAKDGSYLKHIFVCEEQKDEGILSSIAIFRPNKDVISSEYLMYLLKSPSVFNDVKNNYVSGSALPRIVLKDFKKVKFKIHDRYIQNKIVNILSRLDEKIKLNNMINNNLEQQAYALYQAFFSPKSGTRGKIVTLDQYCSIFTGKKNANASVNNGKYKFFTCAPEALQIDSYIYDGNAIIVSGNGAYTGRTRFYSGKFDLYQRTYACTLLDNINSEFIFPLYWFVKLELSKKIMGGTRGSAIPYIVMNDLAKFEFIYNEETFNKYTQIFKGLTEAIQANEFENEYLFQIRDTLLPKLMSGELDVSNIDI